jgi:hypothetical protein
MFALSPKCTVCVCTVARRVHNSGKGNDQVEVYTDADWAGCVDDHKSVSGCALFMNKS